MIKVRILFIKILFISTAFFLAIGCKNNGLTIKPFTNKVGVIVGDSIFYGNNLEKLIFHDTSYIIDSIVFSRYSKQKEIKSVCMYKGGKRVFENIFYYRNGKPKKYIFIDEDNDRFFYQCNYDSSGKLVNTLGQIFFQGYIKGIDKDLQVKHNDTVYINIFYPNPPDLSASLFVKFGKKNIDVFSNNTYIDCLKSVYVTTKTDTVQNLWHKIDIWLRIDYGGLTKDSVDLYHNPLYYKVKE